MLLPNSAKVPSSCLPVIQSHKYTCLTGPQRPVQGPGESGLSEQCKSKVDARRNEWSGNTTGIRSLQCTTTLFAFHGWSDQCLYIQWWTGDLNKNLPNSGEHGIALMATQCLSTSPIEALSVGTYLFRPRRLPNSPAASPLEKQGKGRSSPIQTSFLLC